MIPTVIRSYLDQQKLGYAHHIHAAAMTAQELAAREHVTGRRVLKPVIVKVDGQLAFAVVAASEKVNLGMLEEATGARVELVPEGEFASRFVPCEAGAEPPLALFGLPIFFDEKLERAGPDDHAGRHPPGRGGAGHQGLDERREGPAGGQPGRADRVAPGRRYIPSSFMSRACIAFLRGSSWQLSMARAQASRALFWKPSCS